MSPVPLKPISSDALAPHQVAISSAEPGAEIWRLLAQFYQHKWLLLTAVLLACGTAFFLTERLTRLYQADCTIEFDPNPIKPLGRSADDDASMGALYWSSREFFATQSKIMTSRALAERVVAKLGLNHNPDFFGVPEQAKKGWNGVAVTEAAQALQRRISVDQERDTNIVHIRITDPKPELSMLLANAVADAYIEKIMQDKLGSTTSALEWLSTQLDSLKGQLERSELSLHEFVQEKANLSMPFEEQQKLVSADIQRFNGTLSETRLKRVELAARLESLLAAQNQDPLLINHPAMAESDTVNNLRAKYYEKMAEREALAIKYGDQHPQIRALDLELTLLRDELHAEIDRFVTNARLELNETQSIENGVQGMLAQANRAGLELNLQEITYRRLQRERDNSARLYGSILERTADTDLAHALQVSFVRVVDRALTPTFSIYPSYHKNLTIGGLLGLVVGIGLALLLTQLDRVIRTVEEAEAFGVTVLGVMPRIDQGSPIPGVRHGRRRWRTASDPVTNRDLVVHTHPKSSTAECCRTIRTNLTFMSADRPQRAIVVTSASPREGKTTVAICVAISLAQGGKRVLLVDTDLRKPRLHKALGLQNTRGTTTVLVGEHTASEATQRTEIPGLELLASGPIPPNPAELLHTKQFHDLIAELSGRYDHILYDSPPLAAVTDAAIIAPQVDGVLLVVHGQKTTRDALRSALRQLRDVNARITGGVLNDVDLSTRNYGYGAYYYYHSEGYYETQEQQADAPAAES
jgi:succinoglycan biosynthesis transport protein ExoP